MASLPVTRSPAPPGGCSWNATLRAAPGPGQIRARADRDRPGSRTSDIHSAASGQCQSGSVTVGLARPYCAATARRLARCSDAAQPQAAVTLPGHGCILPARPCGPGGPECRSRVARPDQVRWLDGLTSLVPCLARASKWRRADSAAGRLQTVKFIFG